VKNNLSFYSIIAGLAVGIAMASLSFYLQTLSTSIISKAGSGKKRVVLFGIMYLFRYLIYIGIIIFGILYLSANPIFAIISYILFFIFCMWKKSEDLKRVIRKDIR
jgi:hypothetical protein